MPNDAQPPSSGSSKKTRYIIGSIVILLLLGWFATRSAGFLAMRAAGVNATPNADGSATYSNTEGTVTVGGGSMPSNWPSDAPTNYVGASIQYSGSSNPQTGKAGAAVIYNVNASVKSVYDYYNSRLKMEGWTIDAVTSMAAGANVIVAKKDTRTFSVYIVSTGANAVSVTAGMEL
jgi:hypothetical protein